MTDSALYQLGVDLDRTDTSSTFDQGAELDTRNGKVMYVKAGAAISQYDVVVLSPASAAASVSVEAVPASTGNLGGKTLGFAQTSIAVSSFGWVHTEINKEGRVNVAAGCEPNVPLYTTGTGGVLDDATVSAGQILGVFALASAASASAVPFIAKNPVAKIDEV